MNTTRSSTERDRTPGAARALTVYEPMPNACYSVDVVARLARVSRHRVAVYCRHGLVRPLDSDPGEAGWMFDSDAVGCIRRLEQLRAAFELNLPAAQLVLSLAEEVEQLRRELRFLRER